MIGLTSTWRFVGYVKRQNALAVGAVLILGVVVNLSWTVGLARSVGAAGTGLVGLMVATALVSSLVARLGTDNLLLRSVVRHSSLMRGDPVDAEPADITRSALALSVGTAMFGAAFTLVVALGDGSTKLLAVGLGLTLNVVISYQYLGSEVLKGAGRPIAATALQSLFLPACLSGCALLFILLDTISIFNPRVHPTAVLAITALGTGVGAAIARGAVRRLMALRRQGRFTPGPVARMSAPFLSTSLLNLLMSQGFIAIAAIVLTTDELGALTVASRVALLVGLPLVAVNFTMAAPILQVASREPTDLVSLWRRSAAFATIGATVLAVIVALGTAAVVRLFGTAFADLRGALLFLIAAQVINSTTGSVGFVLIGYGHEGVLARTSAAATIVLLAGTVGLGRYGPVGAACAVLLASLTQNSLNLFYALRDRSAFDGR